MPRTVIGSARTAAGSRSATARLDIPNGGFESAPSFTAASNTASRWINGLAAGSTTNDQWRWGTLNSTGSTTVWTARFDPTNSVTGSNSMKLSTTAAAASVEISPFAATITAVSIRRYAIPVLPSTKYAWSFWMKTNYVSGDSSDGAHVLWRETDTTGLSQTQSTTTTKVKTTTGWTYYTGTITTNASTAFIYPRLKIIGNTGTATLVMDAWWDAIQIMPAARSVIT